MTSRTSTLRSVVPLAKQFILLLQEEYTRWRSTIRWLDGKTIQCRILREASAELVFSGDKVKATGRWSSRRPDLAFTLSRKTLVSLIEGTETPTEAVFNGTLRVAGTSADLTHTNDLFIDVMDRLYVSQTFEQLYSEFKGIRIKPLRTKVLLEMNGHRRRRVRIVGSTTPTQGGTRRRMIDQRLTLDRRNDIRKPRE